MNFEISQELEDLRTDIEEHETIIRLIQTNRSKLCTENMDTLDNIIVNMSYDAHCISDILFALSISKQFETMYDLSTMLVMDDFSCYLSTAELHRVNDIIVAKALELSRSYSPLDRYYGSLKRSQWKYKEAEELDLLGDETEIPIFLKIKNRLKVGISSVIIMINQVRLYTTYKAESATLLYELITLKNELVWYRDLLDILVWLYAYSAPKVNVIFDEFYQLEEKLEEIQDKILDMGDVIKTFEHMPKSDMLQYIESLQSEFVISDTLSKK